MDCEGSHTLSILPLSGFLMEALSYFTMNGVEIRDVDYIKVSGVDTKQPPVLRSITAAIDPTNMKDLEIIFGVGNVSQGDLLVYTTEDLYILDIFGIGDRKVQSFLFYLGNEYRVMACQDWTLQSGTKIYQARRHIEQSG